MTWQPFPIAVLPEPVHDYVEQGAKAIGCDPAYIALPLLTALGAAIGNTRVIQLKRNWTEPPLLWTLIVGESGTQKSPACDLGTAFVRARQDLLFAEQQALQADHPPAEANPATLPPPRLFVSDVTLEALAVRLKSAPRGLLLIRDEAAGWLRSFDQYRAGRGGDLAHYLSMHRAASLTMDRKHGNHATLHVPRAFVAITGGLQTAMLPRLLTPECCASGLTARLLLAMPPHHSRQWNEIDIGPATVHRLQTVFDRLWELQGVPGPLSDSPRALPLDDEAKAIWLRFFHAHAGELANTGDDLAAAWSKLEGYCPRLALILHLVRWADRANGAGPDAIDPISLDHAAKLTSWFARETRRIYQVFLPDRSTAERDEWMILSWIRRQGGSISPHELATRYRRLFSCADAAEDMLRRLANAGWLTGHVIPSDRGGRPAVVYRLTTVTPLAPANSMPMLFNREK